MPSTPGVLPERRHDPAVVAQLDRVAGRAAGGHAVDVELGDLDRQPGGGEPVEVRPVHRHVPGGRERVTLYADGVDQLLALEDVDDLEVLRGRGVGVRDAVVVEHQLRVGEVLLGQPEGVEDPVPAGAIGAVRTAERPRVVPARVAVVALVGRVRAVGRVVQRLVDDLQPGDVRVARRDGREPLVELGELFLGRQRGHPRRLLVAPDQHVEVEREAVGLGDAVRLVEVVPAHRRRARRPGRAAPLAGVLGRHLVEVLREQGPSELVDAPEPLVLPVDREARARLRRRRRRRQQRERNGRGDGLGPGIRRVSSSSPPRDQFG